MQRVLIIGCGYVGEALAGLLENDGVEVIGVRRHPPRRGSASVYIAADLSEPESFAGSLTGVSQVFFMPSPDSGSAEAYEKVYGRGLETVLTMIGESQTPPPLVLVSSSSVYGEDGGQWVDEATPVHPAKETGVVVARAEKQVWAANPENTVMRFSGIYGPGREGLIDRVRLGQRVQFGPPYYTNRVHRDDCAGALRFLFRKRNAGELVDPLYVATDSTPAPKWEVFDWLARAVHVPPPEKGIKPGAAQNKRLTNKRLLDAGYRLKFASYKDGYGSLLNIG
ncbi:MAG: NAD-dependent epimerase/dehydratase family protein [Terriglobia bacterium]